MSIGSSLVLILVNHDLSSDNYNGGKNWERNIDGCLWSTIKLLSHQLPCGSDKNHKKKPL